MDITTILDCFLKLCCAITVTLIVPWIKSKRKNEKVAYALQIAEEIGKIAYTAVSAANEMDITGELTKIAKTKAEYAMEIAEKELAEKGITYDKDILTAKIKAAVTLLRTEISGTNAEKK